MRKVTTALLITAACVMAIYGREAVSQPVCDKACLEGIADRYRAAYVKHDPGLAPIAKDVRFTENNVEMRFPDASWDTVTQEVGPALTISDPSGGKCRHLHCDHAVGYPGVSGGASESTAWQDHGDRAHRVDEA